jgi:hypothetical protein
MLTRQQSDPNPLGKVLRIKAKKLSHIALSEASPTEPIVRPPSPVLRAAWNRGNFSYWQRRFWTLLKE